MPQMNYDRGHYRVFDQLLKFKLDKVALLIVDMQVGFVAPGAAMEVPQGRDIIANIQRLARFCRGVGMPVIYTRFIYSPAIPTLHGELHVEHKPVQPGIEPGPGRPSNCCLEGDESSHVTPELAPEPGDLVIDKHGYDAFHASPLDSSLRARGIENLIVTGVMTDICVLATVSGAMHHGYKVTVVSDGVATLWPEIQEASLDIMARAYARVMSIEEVAVELQYVNNNSPVPVIQA